MKRIFYFGLFFFLPGMLCAQDKVELPIWHVGNKWVFEYPSPHLKIKGEIEIVSADRDTYTVKFIDDICVYETQGFNTIIFEKSTLHRSHALRGTIREKYKRGRRTIFNFPLFPGKQWKDSYSSVSLVKGVETIPLDYYEIYKLLGWEDIEVKAGKFRAIKMELTVGHEAKGNTPAFEATNLYWYSPDVKYFVKCQYDPIARGMITGLFNWELTSYKLNK